MKRALFFITLLFFLSTFCFACDGVATIEEGLIRTVHQLNDKNYVVRDFCESASPKINNGDIISTNLLENSAREKTNQETKIVLGFDNFQQNELTINQTNTSQIATYNGPFLSYTKVNEIVFCGKDKKSLIEAIDIETYYFDEFNIKGIFNNSPIENNCDNNKICCAIAVQKNKSIFTINGLYIITLGIVMLTIFLIFVSINSVAKIAKKPKDDFRILGLIIPIFVVILLSIILSNNLLGAIYSIPLIPLLLIEYILRKTPNQFRLNALIIIQIGIMAAVTIITLANLIQ